MNISIDERTVKIAEFIIRTGCTVRFAATKFNLSKSTLHKDLTVRLPKLSPTLFEKVSEVFKTNLQERHIRGGESTRKMYARLKTKKV